MAYPVDPFGLRLLHLRLPPPISDARRDHAGKRPGLFGQFNDCQANQFQKAKGRHRFIFVVCLNETGEGDEAAKSIVPIVRCQSPADLPSERSPSGC